MVLFDAVDDRWGGRSGLLRLIGRLIGFAFFTYLLIEVGAFSGSLWVTVLSGAALCGAVAITLLRTFRGFDRLAVVVCAAMMVSGALINPSVQNVGTVFFVIGGITLLGQPELPVRVGVGISVAVGLLIVGQALFIRQHWGFWLSDVFGAFAVVLFGLNRRQRVIRLRQERELAARSAELEQRNQELLAQTEETRREAARVAALRERGRIARDLHDLLAHSLGGLVVQLDAADAELERGHQDRAAERLRMSRQLAVDGLREARAAVNELRADDGDHPDTTKDASASAADGGVDLQSVLAPVLRGPVGLHLGVDLDVVGEPRPVHAGVATTLAAVCREALTNVNKHAPSGGVSVTLAYQPDALQVEVVNGVPDDAAPTELSASGAGAGLAGLRERLDLLAGTLIAGREGRRWVLSASCPQPYPSALAAPATVVR